MLEVRGAPQPPKVEGSVGPPSPKQTYSHSSYLWYFGPRIMPPTLLPFGGLSVKLDCFSVFLTVSLIFSFFRSLKSVTTHPFLS